MKIEVIKDTSHRISSGRSMDFKAGSVVDRIPRKIGDALIARGDAVEVKDKPLTEKET